MELTMNEAMQIMEDNIRENINCQKIYKALFDTYLQTFLDSGLDLDKSSREANKLCVINTWKEYCVLTSRMREEFKKAIEAKNA